MTGWILLIIGSYLLGSIPFGLLLAKAHGKDLRKIGSGNIGATNVSRALGRKWAYVCFVLDVCKGLVPMLVGNYLATETTPGQLTLRLVAGCAAITGHIFPLYLRFKGGKGVATSLGVVLGLYPYFTFAGFICFILWCVVVLLWKYVSLASITAACTFPVALLIAILSRPSWRLENLWPLLVVAIIMPALVVLRHKENLKRLLAGTENKIMQKNKESTVNNPEPNNE